MTNAYADQIAAGVAWLDEQHPDWVEVFAHDKGAGLHMDDCDRCVLGHVLGSYWHKQSPVYRYGGVHWRSLSTHDAESLRRNAALLTRAGAELGFALPDPNCYYVEDDDEVEEKWNELGAGWRKVIEKRLADQGLMVS
jgi:hypothetical protein